MSSLAERLKTARIAAHLTQQQLADLVKIKQQSIQKLESGITKTTNRITDFARVLNVSPAWLQFGDESERSKSPRGFAPIIPWTAILNFIGSDYPLPADTKFLSIPTYYPPRLHSESKHIFALQIKNDAMVGRSMAFYEQSIIFVDIGIDPKSGDYVLIYNKDTKQEPMFRRLIIEGDTPIFIALNDNYPALSGKQWGILGVIFGEQKIIN